MPEFWSSLSLHCFFGYLCCVLSLQLCYSLSPVLSSFIDRKARDRIKLGANVVIKINLAMTIFLGQQRKACPRVCPCTVELTAYYFFVSFIFLLKLKIVRFPSHLFTTLIALGCRSFFNIGLLPAVDFKSIT